jgi:hypothetical protein
MKNHILLLCLLTSQWSFAQKHDPKKDTTRYNVVTQPVQVSGTIDMVPGVTIYERTDYQGSTAKFIKPSSGRYNFPFPTQHVSIKIPGGKMLYIKTRDGEFTVEDAYVGSQRDITLREVLGVRMDDTASIRISFNGISTEVHNMDCLRFGGKVQVRVKEINPDEPSLESAMRWKILYAGAPNPGNDRFTYPIFNLPTTILSDNRYATELNRGFVFNNNPVPVLTEQGHYGSRIMQNSANVFTVGRSALREGRVKIWIQTDLASAHKTCDLCDDFSSNVKMLHVAYESIPINKTYGDGKIVDAAHPYFVIGPYAAHGNRDGSAITASAGTDKNFRVHFAVSGY